MLGSNHFIFAFLRLERVELGYWPFVKELTHSETAKIIANHPQVTNDLDKGRNIKAFTLFFNYELFLVSYMYMYLY